MIIRGRNSRGYFAMCLAMATALAVVPGAGAKERKPAQQQTGNVIAHLTLEGAVASQMYLQAQGDKRYLYVDQGTDQGYTVVDVTKPSQPSVVKHTSSGKLQVVGPNLALAEAPDQSKTVARSHPPTESVTVMDTTDPANPKAIQTFNGVTGVLQDNGRGLVYLTNSEGLWILQHAGATVRPARKKKPCDSESAISAMPPDCE
jgi:hypothetical protein